MQKADEGQSTNNVSALRFGLIDNGYLPIPLYGKEPPIYGKNNKRKGLASWQKIDTVSPEMIAMWTAQWPDAVNTGVLTKNTPALDIDILNPDVAKAVEALVRDYYEERGNVLVRFGLPPKRAIPFRTDAPFAKILRNLIAPDGSEHKLELLASGQQFTSQAQPLEAAE